MGFFPPSFKNNSCLTDLLSDALEYPLTKICWLSSDVGMELQVKRRHSSSDMVFSVMKVTL